MWFQDDHLKCQAILKSKSLGDQWGGEGTWGVGQEVPVPA